MAHVREVLAVLVGISCVSLGAHAQTDADRERARALQREGIRHYQEGEYLQALEKFKQVFELVQSPKVHFNLGETYFQLGRPLEALKHYELFVQGVSEKERPDEWARANAQIAKLQGEVATLLVQCPIVGATVRVDGEIVGTTPLTRPIRMMPGAHVVLVEKAGYEQVVLNIRLAAGEGVSQRVELITEEEGARKRKAYQRLEAERRAKEEQLRMAQERARARAARQRQALRISGWTGLLVGTGGLVVGGTCGFLARREAQRIEGAPEGAPWEELQSHKDRHKVYAGVSTYSLSIGAGLAVVGGTLLLVSFRRSFEEGAPPPSSRGILSAVPGRLSFVPSLIVEHSGGGGLLRVGVSGHF